MRCRGRAVGPRGRRSKRGNRGRIRQARQQIRRKSRDWVGFGVDPGREVDERFRRAGKQAPGGAKIAAMQQWVVFAA